MSEKGRGVPDKAPIISRAINALHFRLLLFSVRYHYSHNVGITDKPLVSPYVPNRSTLEYSNPDLKWEGLKHRVFLSLW
jgi:hypothetical protein